MRRRLGWMFVVVLVLASCAPKDDDQLSGDERADALRSSAHAPRTFSFRHTSQPLKLAVSGEVEDDYRYRATFSIGDRPAYEEVVVDDHRAIRLVDPSALPEPARANAALAPLLSGAWMADAANAPPEFVKADVPARLIDPSVVLEKVRYLENVQQDPERKDVVKFAAFYDPGSTEYLRRNDKFPPHEKDGIRYDVLPGSYQGDQMFREGIPDDLVKQLERSFLYLSWWFKEGRVTRVELFFDVDVKAVTRDMKASAERQAKRAGIPVENVPLLAVPRPYRQTYTFKYPKEPVRVALPPTTGTVTLPPIASAVPNAPVAPPVVAPPVPGGTS